jgi:hypothetical protein
MQMRNSAGSLNATTTEAPLASLTGTGLLARTGSRDVRVPQPDVGGEPGASGVLAGGCPPPALR